MECPTHISQGLYHLMFHLDARVLRPLKYCHIIQKINERRKIKKRQQQGGGAEKKRQVHKNWGSEL